MPGDKLGCHVKDRTLSMMEVHPKLIQLRRERAERHKLPYVYWPMAAYEQLWQANNNPNPFSEGLKTKAK